MNALSSASAAPERGRRPVTRLVLGSMFTAALLAGLAAAPTTAAADEPRNEPVSIIFLGISQPDDPPMGPGNPPDVWFTCSRDGSVDERSTHPTPEDACASLRAVDGDFEELPALNGFCPAVWAPVRVEAQGLWYPNEGDDYGNVRYEAEFANSCVARLSTDNVFNF